MLYLCGLFLATRRFERRRLSIPHRIHVNGIRGKSTVTRYVAAILRDSGLHTYGKTTGTAARVITPDGRDAIIKRRGYPNVSEQLTMMSSFARRKAEAVVVECMAVNPDYQQWLEDKVMRSHIGIITNVRIDHQEEMGQGLLDIARSIGRTIPRRGILVTAERNPEVLAHFRKECQRKGTVLIEAPTSKVKKFDLQRFDHVAHKDNVAVGLAVAKLYKVSQKRALDAMVATRSDPGAFNVETIRYKGKTIVWANLFAVNDKESFAQIADSLAKEYGSHHRVAVLNNRHDRPSRVAMFCELALQHLTAQTVVSFGDYERQVAQHMDGQPVDVVALGNASDSAQLDGEALFDAIISSVAAKKILLVGAVNIHTPQAERLLDYMTNALGIPGEDLALETYRTSHFNLPRVSLKSGRLARLRLTDPQGNRS